VKQWTTHAVMAFIPLHDDLRSSRSRPQSSSPWSFPRDLTSSNNPFINANAQTSHVQAPYDHTAFRSRLLGNVISQPVSRLQQSERVTCIVFPSAALEMSSEAQRSGGKKLPGCGAHDRRIESHQKPLSYTALR